MSSRGPHRIKKQKTDTSALGRLVLGIAVIEPLMTIPQIYQIWAHHDARGVSLSTWSFYILSAIIWLFYGFKIKDIPLIVASTLWVVMEGFVVLGILLY